MCVCAFLCVEKGRHCLCQE